MPGDGKSGSFARGRLLYVLSFRIPILGGISGVLGGGVHREDRQGREGEEWAGDGATVRVLRMFES